MLCYCFDIPEEDYREAMRNETGEEIRAFVVRQTAGKRCACDIRNPSGRCCLADFQRLMEEIT